MYGVRPFCFIFNIPVWIMKTHHTSKKYTKYKKKKYQLNKLIDILDAVEYANPDGVWEPSTLFEGGVPLVKGTLEYDNALCMASRHMHRVPDLIMRTGIPDETTQYIYYCSGTEPLRLKCPHVSPEPLVLENVLKYDSSYAEEEEDDYNDGDDRPGSPHEGSSGATEEENGSGEGGTDGGGRGL